VADHQRMRPGDHARRFGAFYALLAGIVILLLVGTVIVLRCLSQSTPSPAPRRYAISVDAARVVAPLPSEAIGVNAGVWDSRLHDDIVAPLLRQAGVSLVRYPGGSTADNYQWRTNSYTPGHDGYVDPANNFDSFMRTVVQPAHLHALITVNYGSNATGTGGADPSNAAAWVAEANKTRHDGVTYWELGNELYGNGYYDRRWETDLHDNHSPSAYARNALAFIHAMKAVDPSIQVGLDLAVPGDWVDHEGGGRENWNDTVLAGACSAADFVSVHWYAQEAGMESDAGLLASPLQASGIVAQLHALLTRHCGARAGRIGIMMTESNSVNGPPGKQAVSIVNGLFLVEDYLAWLQAGVRNVTWWDLHNGPVSNGNNSPILAGTTGYGDYGLLSYGQSPEPPPNTPFPPYTALRLLARAFTPGAVFVQTSSHDPALTIAALSQPDGRLALLAVNTSPSSEATLTPHIVDLPTIVSAQVTRFGADQPALSTRDIPVHGGQISYIVPPYSAVVLELATSAYRRPTTTATAVAIPMGPASPAAMPTTTLSATATHALATPRTTPRTTPRASASSTQTLTPSPTATASSTQTLTPSPTATASSTQTLTPSPTATASSTQTLTPTASSTQTLTPTASSTQTPTQ